LKGLVEEDMDFNTWLVYLLAAIGLSLSPGPNGLLALTHGALHGRRKALYTIFGGAFGFVAVVALSMFGIGALLKTSLVWLTVMKWVGGAYLVWLGVQVWRSPPIGLDVRGSVEPRPGWSLFQQGALSALTNPKGILFFAAFLPQFIDPARSLFVQFVIMAGTFAAIARSLRSCSSPAWLIASAPGFVGWGGASTRPAAACSSR
jgi:threonine/homoserine/homoserine lactone efflux protein